MEAILPGQRLGQLVVDVEPQIYETCETLLSRFRSLLRSLLLSILLNIERQGSSLRAKKSGKERNKGMEFAKVQTCKRI